jgi:hypothetical protein
LNGIDIVFIVLIVGLAALAVRGIVARKRKGGSCGCCDGTCEHGHMPHHDKPVNDPQPRD